ncbi:uncharacterized protein LOC106650997 isoform X1 [Trichogramma pretiosum]|uniref:uncharacterized protein LOC106650997 isoform X1 n=2 Tax=Trichogramma pretiosum TaxID=7493 RepID=UPI0006C998D3|nr:uncharacterized protein LOC106650997 isoform X1 [Trichogramma pretiosum]
MFLFKRRVSDNQDSLSAGPSIKSWYNDFMEKVSGLGRAATGAVISKRNVDDDTPEIGGVASTENESATTTTAAAAAAAAPETGNVTTGSSGNGGNSSNAEPPAGSSTAESGPSASPSQKSEEAVDGDTPDIPNVVEYHLKVTPRNNNNSKKSAEKQVQVHESTDTSSSLAGNNMTLGNGNGTMKDKPTITEEQRKELTLRLSKLSIDSNVFEGSSDLPQVFQVKYLGSHDARGLWGIRHTRKPTDNMVAAAKALPSGTILPFQKLVVSEDGIGLLPFGQRGKSESKIYPIETISYGVQDLVYTRVFSMILVRETDNFRRLTPFECHAFVCESKHHARQITYALGAAFKIYSQYVKERSDESETKNRSREFALELRNPNEVQIDDTLKVDR